MYVYLSIFSSNRIYRLIGVFMWGFFCVVFDYVFIIKKVFLNCVL